MVGERSALAHRLRQQAQQRARQCQQREQAKVDLRPQIEGAEYAGVSRDTIYTACERRELNHARVGGRRAIRLKAAWVDSWLERHAQGTVESRANAPTTGS